MKKQDKTQKEIILMVLEQRKDWTPSYDLIKVWFRNYWIGSGSDRIARYLVKEGLVERTQKDGYAQYRLKQKQGCFNI